MKTELTKKLLEKWNRFDKNKAYVKERFEYLAIKCIEDFGYKFKEDTQFESDLLDKYQEHLLDEYVNDGVSVKEWFFKNFCQIGMHASDHEAYCDHALIKTPVENNIKLSEIPSIPERFDLPQTDFTQAVKEYIKTLEG